MSSFSIKAVPMWRQLNNTQQGALLALAASAVAVVVGALVRQLSDHIGLFQILFARQMVFLVLLLPAMFSTGKALFKPQRLDLHGLRILGAFATLYLGFVTVSHLPLADATALSFTSVLFVAAIAQFCLRESVTPSRWFTLLLGFVAVLLITQPQFDNPNINYIVCGLAAALGGAVAATCVRRLSQSQPKTLLMSYQAVAVALLALPLALQQWQWPTPEQGLMLLLVGALSSLATSMGVSAYQKGEANIISNLNYAQMIFAIALGYWLFDERPNLLAIAGVVLLFASALLPLWRQRR